MTLEITALIYIIGSTILYTKGNWILATVAILSFFIGAVVATIKYNK